MLKLVKYLRFALARDRDDYLIMKTVKLSENMTQISSELKSVTIQCTAMLSAIMYAMDSQSWWPIGLLLSFKLPERAA